MSAAPALWLSPDPLILASGSATRRFLLEAAGLPVRVRPASVDERAVERDVVARGASSDMVAAALALAKAISPFRGEGMAGLVLGGDQTLSIDGEALHKPASLAAAREQIGRLAGRTHLLHSAIALVRNGTILFQTVETVRMTMRPLSAGFIDRYVAAAGESVGDSVGAYKLEGLGIHLFERIEGDQSTVMGLPMLPLLRALRDAGVLAA